MSIRCYRSFAPFPPAPIALRCRALTHSPLRNFRTSQRSFSGCDHPRGSPPGRNLQSEISLTYLIVGLGASFAGYIAWNTYTKLPQQEAEDHLEQLKFVEVAEMPANVRQGWPGNLSAEQEQKLKQFWEKLDRLTRVQSDRASIDSSSPSTSSPASPEGKKKKRFSMFRKKEDGEGDDEDKHGQMKDFKQALKDLTPEQLRTTIWSMVKLDDPDALMLRFLRARKWDVQKAVVMLVSTVHWRSQDVHLDDDLVPKGELHFAELAKHGSGSEKKLGEDFLTQLRAGKSFVHGVDKDGRPLCFVRVKLHRAGEQTEEALEKFTIWTIETTRMMLRAPVDTAVIVFDMTDFSMANMDYTPVKFMIKVFEANYPESLGAVCVFRSPWIFSSVWNIIKGWLDPVVASKVHFAKDASELSEFVPMENIPTALGGKETFEWKYLEPQPGENQLIEDRSTRDSILEKREKLVEQYEEATRQWVFGSDSAKSARERSELAKQLQANYWQLDPYVRAKTVYDRFGVLQPGGVYHPYPEKAASSTPPGATPEISEKAVANGSSTGPSNAAANGTTQPAQNGSAESGSKYQAAAAASVPASVAAPSASLGSTAPAAPRLSTERGTRKSGDAIRGDNESVYYDAVE